MRGLSGGARSRCLCAFSIMTMAASIMAPMAMAMPPRLMMLEPRPSSFIARNDIRMPTGSMRIATRALRTCSRNTMQTSATTSALLEQRAAQGLDGAVDQLGAVVDRHHLHALGQRRRDLRQPRLDVGDDVERVGAEALQGDAAGHLAFAVELGDAAPLVGPKLDAGDVLEQHRRAAVGLDDDAFEVGDALDVAAAAHHELVLGELDRAAADVHVVLADDLAHLGQRNAEASACGRDR